MSDQTVVPIEILLVEDSPTDALLTREALTFARMRNVLHHVKDGDAALRFLRREGVHRQAPRPSLILLDLNLPGLSGTEVLAAIKQDQSLRRIPVVVLTTSRAEADVLRAYGLHANCYIAKPVDFGKFAEVVRSINDFWFSVVTLPVT